MIAKLIDWCIRNRAMVLLLTLFLIVAGVWAVFNIKVDAIPDLSDVQVIIYTEYTGQAPQIVEDQVTYPLTKAMLAVPKSKVVRGYSMFGTSFVYIIFEDGTDLYWARSRVLERRHAADRARCDRRRMGLRVRPLDGPVLPGPSERHVARSADRQVVRRGVGGARRPRSAAPPHPPSHLRGQGP
jgi:hypothetical protein